MKVKVSGNNKDLERYFTKQKEQYRSGLVLLMWRALSILEASVIQNIRKNLTVRTGKLMNSIPESKKIEEKHKGNLDTITGSLGPQGVKYAAIHEFGGRIDSKGKALMFPVSENRRRDGTPRVMLDEVPDEDLVWLKGMVFRMIGGKRKGHPGRLKPLFLLRKSVTIPARPYLRPALEKNADRIAEKFGLFLSTTIEVKND